MRAIAILIILAVVGFFGYEYAVNQRTPMEAISVLTGTAAAEEEAIAEALAEAQAAAEAAAAQAAADAAAAEEAAAAEAAAAEEAAAQAAAEAEAAVQAAAAEAEAAAQAAAEEAAAAAAEVVEGGEDLMAMAGELLSVEGFDFDKVTALLEGSDLSDTQKTTLTNALSVAQDNPTLLQPVLDNIRNLMGL